MKNINKDYKEARFATLVDTIVEFDPEITPIGKRNFIYNILRNLKSGREYWVQILLKLFL